jgi:hypothetical protein
MFTVYCNLEYLSFLLSGLFCKEEDALYGLERFSVDEIEGLYISSADSTGWLATFLELRYLFL